jgi:hypothetical protein
VPSVLFKKIKANIYNRDLYELCDEMWILYDFVWFYVVRTFMWFYMVYVPWYLCNVFMWIYLLFVRDIFNLEINKIMRSIWFCEVVTLGDLFYLINKIRYEK